MKILCPNCKCVFDFNARNSLGLTPMQNALLKLADGTMTASEMGKKLSRSSTSIKAGIGILWHKGFDAKYKLEEAPEHVRDQNIHDEYERGGTTFKKLGKKHGICSQRVGQIYHKYARRARRQRELRG